MSLSPTDDLREANDRIEELEAALLHLIDLYGHNPAVAPTPEHAVALDAARAALSGGDRT